MCGVYIVTFPSVHLPHTVQFVVCSVHCSVQLLLKYCVWCIVKCTKVILRNVVKCAFMSETLYCVDSGTQCKKLNVFWHSATRCNTVEDREMQVNAGLPLSGTNSVGSVGQIKACYFNQSGGCSWWSTLSSSSSSGMMMMMMNTMLLSVTGEESRYVQQSYFRCW